MNEIYDLYTDFVESCAVNRLSKLEELSPTRTLWNLVVITAISEEQKKCYEKQIQMKLESKKLPNKFKYVIVNDPNYCKIGSGGSTMNVIKQLYSKYSEEFFSMKILLIHAGGYSQRMPNCTVLGKIFSSISSESIYINDFLDIKLAIYTPFAVEMQPGIFLASSDDVITCKLNEQLEASKLFGLNNDFILIAHKSSLTIGKDHGVYAVDGTSKSSKFNVFDCKFVLQKPSIDKMMQMSVCLDENSVLSDSCFYFSNKIAKILLDFYDLYFEKICENKIEIDAYRDFLQPLGSQPMSLSDYLNGLNLKNSQLNIELFTKLYSLMSNRRSLVINLTDSIFYHLGTTNELLDFYLNENSLEAIEFRKNICFSKLKIKNENVDWSILKGCVQNSIVNSDCKLSNLSLLEYSYIDKGIKLVLNDYCFLNNCAIKISELNAYDLNSFNVPPNVCMHTLAISDISNQSKFVTIFYNRNDDLKKCYNEQAQVVFLGKPMLKQLADKIKLTNNSNTIWNLKLFKAFNTMSESFVKSLEFINAYLNNMDDCFFDSYLDTCYSLFDLLKLQNYTNMLNFRYHNKLL